MQPSYTRNDYVKELGIEDLPHAVQDEVIARVSTGILKHLFIELLARIPEGEQEQFKLLVDEGRGAEAEAFAQKHIPDLATFIASETKKGLQEFKDLAAS